MKTLNALLVIVLLSGCTLASLDEGAVEGVIEGPRTVPPNDAAISQMLHNNTSKSWKAHRFTLMDLPGFQVCRLDDTIRLDEDGNFKYNGGAELCGAEDNVTVKYGSWFVQNGMIIFSENESTVYQAKILGLVQDTLVVSGSYLGLEVKGLYISEL